MIRRSIREWERIAYGDSDKTIPEKHADRLASVARGSKFSGRDGQGVLEHGRNSLRARGVIGVIASSGCQLEILPKLEGVDDAEIDDVTLRKRLIHMLAVVHDLSIEAGTVTQLGWQRDTVLELLIRIFCAKLTDAVRQGMPRQYIEHEEDIPSLKGRLNVTRQFSTLAVSPHKLACRFDVLSADIALNQVMSAAVKKLSRLSQALDNQQSLRELSFVYASISNVPANALPWDRITLNRTNQRWRDLLNFSRLFLSDKYQQTNTGQTDGHALLFEMNNLFEQYVAKLLSRALEGSNSRVVAQGGHRNCLYENETGRFRTRPDIIVRQGEQVSLIIDTKWKRITAHIEDPKQGVSQADVYQMMAYNQLYDCPNVILLYPHHTGLSKEPNLKQYSIVSSNSKDKLFVATLDLSGNAKAHKDALLKIANLFPISKVST